MRPRQSRPRWAISRGDVAPIFRYRLRPCRRPRSPCGGADAGGLGHHRGLCPLDDRAGLVVRPHADDGEGILCGIGQHEPRAHRGLALRLAPQHDHLPLYPRGDARKRPGLSHELPRLSADLPHRRVFSAAGLHAAACHERLRVARGEAGPERAAPRGGDVSPPAARLDGSADLPDVHGDRDDDRD